LLAATVLTLFGSAYYGIYAYRGLVKSLSARSTELPLADKLRDRIAELHETLNKVQDRQKLDEIASAAALPGGSPVQSFWDSDGTLRQSCRVQFDLFCQTLEQYRRQLDANRNRSDLAINDDREERETLSRIDGIVQKIRAGDDTDDTAWRLDNDQRVSTMRADVEALRELAAQLPSYLHDRFRQLASDVRNEYRFANGLAWATTGLTTILLIAGVTLFRKWIARPLATLVQGSRQVAAGHFDHRIHLESQDEMRELAESMNAMTSRFQEIRDDLDCQVRERTKQVVRSEQLASVGFLAAGVAHEINNPLASIAMCSESLEGRLSDLLSKVGQEHAADRDIVRNYLEMIQKEAFRCKQITEKLLDFSRMGDPERHNTDLRELVASVIEMIRHVGKYQNKKVVLRDESPVIAEVCEQELKQVALNLITNALDSVDSGGTVSVSVAARGTNAVLIVEDDGCGMSEEVIQHLFEPFFTRRRGGQGTGLGLSITYRIVEEHNGQIVPHSDGPGKGSKFTVLLPLRQPANRNKKKAA